MKQMMKNGNILGNKDRLFRTKSTYRLRLAKLFNNATQSNYSIENMINNDTQGIKGLLDKMINDPMKSYGGGGVAGARLRLQKIKIITKN